MVNTTNMTIISKATRKNWKRLNAKLDGKLTSRANKTKSKENIIPKEYISSPKILNEIKRIFEIYKDKEFGIGDVIYTQILYNLKNKNLLAKNNVQEFIKEYEKQYNIVDIECIEDFELEDIIGALYQTLLTEGEKNIKGLYYTPNNITNEMVEDTTFENKQTFLDMCCGSGAYMLSLKCDDPNLIYGIDIDPISVMICKYNLILKYKDLEFSPKIYNENYLELFIKDNLTPIQFELLNNKYDYIITNPPWGGKLDKNLMPKEIKSKETSSAFLVRGIEQLKNGGKIKILVPESILNIKTHRDVRKYILENINLEKIKIYNPTFTKVTTRYASIELSNTKNKRYVAIVNGTNKFSIPKSIYENNKDNVFTLFNRQEYKIIKKIQEKGKHSLKQSIFGLGIVTGNNKDKVLAEHRLGTEPIYTGKEIEKYIVKHSEKYIKYDRDEFQQVAPTNVYRSNEKLLYKFISKNLVFSYDNKQRLVLNSANVVIPMIPNYDIKVILGVLNSRIMNFYYNKVFGGVKVLKNNLCELPIPELTFEEKEKIKIEVEKILKHEKDDSQLQKIFYDIYGLTKSQINLIENEQNLRG